MTKLAIIRHGHTAWNRAGRIQGRTDIPLEEKATQGLAEFTLPPEWNTADIYSSPLSRAVETGKIISGRTPVPVPELIEMDWGDWEGKHGQQLKDDPTSNFKDIEDWGWDYSPPNGESPADMWARLDPWLATLTTDSIAVCHIGTMRVLLAKATGWAFSGPAPFRIKRNRLFILDLNPTLAISDPDIIRLDRHVA